MSEPVPPPPVPANTDTRPVDVIRNQTEGRTSKDPRGESAAQPPPMPDVRAGSTVSLSRASESLIQDAVQASLTQALRNVTINGTSAQVTNNRIDFVLPMPSASEQFAQQNAYAPPNNREARDLAVQQKAEYDAQHPEPRTLMGSTTGLGTHSTKGEPAIRHHVDQYGNMVKTEDKPLKKDQHHDKDSEGVQYINEKRNIHDKLNPSNFGKGHIRVLLTRADHGQKVVVNMDIASGAIVENSADEDDTNDVLPDDNEYYFGGFGTKFYCWKEGVLGTIEFGANGMFKPLDT